MNGWIRRMFDNLKENQGGRCSKPGCGETENLEFAHLPGTTTGVKGPGRGRKERYYDIIKNPGSYVLLCKEHHRELDQKNEDKKI